MQGKPVARDLQFRSVWISDVHLGTPSCRVRELLDFLDAVQADRLYLTGDIVDMERLSVKHYWPETHSEVLRRFAKLAGEGTEVIYIPGNHDEPMRALVGSMLSGVAVRHECLHRAADGRRLLVMHGDRFDEVLRVGAFMEHVGCTAYRWLMSTEAGLNRLRVRLGYERRHFAASVKLRFRGAVDYIREFERTACDYARNGGYDGIVCGHIHRPALFEDDGVCYANDGDWVEHCSALAERADGTLALLDWQAEQAPVTLPDTALAPAA